MKIILESEPKKQTYPKLRTCKEDRNLVVLFNNPSTGIVLCGGASWNVGVYHDEWQESKFTDYSGSVVIQND